MAGALTAGCDDEAVSGGLFLGSGTGNYAYQLTNSGQFGVHTFFDWNGNYDIPVLFVLQSQEGGNLQTGLQFVSIDSDGSGVPGHAMNNASPYTGQTIAISASTVPVPSAVWLFGSGLIGLIGVARRKDNA